MAFQQILVQSLFLASLLAATPKLTASQPKYGCEASCGNVSIPYPFGLNPNCYLDSSFLITCNSTHYNPPVPFLGETNLDIVDISLDGHIRASSLVAQDCYNQSGSLSGEIPTFGLYLPNFFISSALNKFVAVGCDTISVIHGSRGKNFTTGCIALCDNIGSVVNGSCAGSGCCQTSIPNGASDFTLAVTSSSNHSDVLDFNPCGYGFVAEEKSYNFSSLDLKDLGNRNSFPVMLDWAVGNETCEEAKKNGSGYACLAFHSECYNSTNGPGYLCNCSSGYQGNPYLIDGCQDSNECAISNPCNQTCTNLQGSFSCSCTEGYQGDGYKNGTGCFLKVESKGSILINVALGISVSIVVLLLASSWIYWILRKRKLMKLREQFFQQNGGIMLQQLLPQHGSSIETAKIFTSEDLKRATNNYDESRIIGQGGFGTVYKGVLIDNKVVAIKKSKVSDKSQIEQFINEVVVLSQINHRNVVKLLGCCLETEVPLLVYEFISNGTLSEHIHGQARGASIPWETRLKIASETAGAIAYLHSAISLPIIHRDIKSTNILLDDSYTAKVSDFGASRLVPVDKTQLTTLVQGTFGYLDPEYFHSSQLTEKSDVYSFGVLLAELLMGEKALSFDRPEEDRNLATYFISTMKDDRLFEVLDKRMMSEANIEQVNEVANLAKRCLRVKGEERPRMKEVAMELEGLRLIHKDQLMGADLYPEELEKLLNHGVSSDGYNGVVGSSNGNSTTVGYDSMRNHIAVPLDDGR